jgi:hypothetical protein
MIIDLQNYEKLLCFFERKVRKDFFDNIENILRIAKT